MGEVKIPVARGKNDGFGCLEFHTSYTEGLELTNGFGF
jgi:hypothetical protein